MIICPLQLQSEGVVPPKIYLMDQNVFVVQSLLVCIYKANAAA